MEPPSPEVSRRKTLTNSAAEFIERRAPEHLKGLQDESEFVPELDRFVPKGVAFDPADLYEESRKRSATFRQTLQRFVAVLKERKIDSQLNIVLKDPLEFTPECISEIINKIGDDRENAAKTSACKNFVRRCYQKMEDNRGVIEGILAMIPVDIYGSVISGGFTLILAAVEKHAEQRQTIQNCLAEIPEKLETIQRLSDIHRASIRLHSCADAVMVAIFTILERVVDKITRTWRIKVAEKAEKLTTRIRSLHLRSKSHPQKPKEGNDVEEPSADGADDKDDRERKLAVIDAVDLLQKEIHRFQEQVNICAQERLGRLETDAGDIKRDLKSIAAQNKHVAKLIKGLDKQSRTRVKYCQALLNETYRLYAADSSFDAKTGGVDHEQLKILREEREARSRRARQRSNHRIASKWLEGLGGFTYDPMIDVKDCLDHVQLLDPDEKNISQWILDSKQLKDWLQEGRSRILTVDLQTRPASLNNPLSFTSALFATSLQSTASFPMLAFFCMHRNNDSPLKDKPGPVALVKSLNSQLLWFTAKKRPSVDLSVPEVQELLPEAKKSLKDGLRLLDALLSLLPAHDIVFVIIDSLSWLSGSDEDEDKMMKKLSRIIEKREDLVIKMMVTDAFAGSYVKSVADTSLHVQDLVSGFGEINVSESRNGIAKQLKSRGDVKDGKGGTMSNDEDEDEDENEDDEDDDEDEDEDDEDDDEDEDEDDEDDEDDDEDESAEDQSEEDSDSDAGD